VEIQISSNKYNAGYYCARMDYSILNRI